MPDHQPAVSLCYAQSLDGSLAARRGAPLALSGPQSLRLTHELRAVHDAILVGIGTVLADDPSLTVRYAEGESPQPVILDSRLRLPLQAKVLCAHPKKAWIAAGEGADLKRQEELEAAGATILRLPETSQGQISLPHLLAALKANGVNSLMVEGGASVLASFLREGLADRVCITIAPVFVGGLTIGDKMRRDGRELGIFPRLMNVLIQTLGEDTIIWGFLKRTS